MMCIFWPLQVAHDAADQFDLKQPEVEPAILEAVRQHGIDVAYQLSRHKRAVISQVSTLEQERLDFIERAVTFRAAQ
ncbi:hypothetical protein DIE21_01750 [Burkholderia sp. Bp9140]|nr:hypothetical protein DIE21_01750 [Burkholderia sp. Bp9140]